MGVSTCLNIVDVWRSLYLTVFACAISTTWFIVFVCMRQQWGPAGDVLTVVIPRGY